MVLVEKTGKHGDGLLYLSVNSEKIKNVGKSLTLAGGQTATNTPLGQKPFAPGREGFFPTNHDFILPQISAVSIDRPRVIQLALTNITIQNRKAKFLKAIRALSQKMRIPLSIEKSEHKPEQYFYSIQQELSDYWTGYYSELLLQVYETITAALDLPGVTIETRLITSYAASGSSDSVLVSCSVRFCPKTGRVFSVRPSPRLFRDGDDRTHGQDRETVHISGFNNDFFFKQITLSFKKAAAVYTGAVVIFCNGQK